MPGPQVDRLVKQILMQLRLAPNLDGAVGEVRKGLDELSTGLSDILAAELEEARAIVERKFEKIEVVHRRSLLRKRPKWYFGPVPGPHWIALELYLRDVKKWGAAVDRIDDASTEIVSLLENPSNRQFSSRGLVVGHVQSGKTANMTAVIAKALDAGYNTIIVLAGMTNKLRHQTQRRLMKDLHDRNPESWQVLTPNMEDGDFRAPAHGGFLSHVDKAQLAVVKKNVSPLEQLKIAVRRTVPAMLDRLRVLVIDDECDQASVNAPRNELDITAINRHIRELLAAFPSATYVGYTATPFANVLINPYRPDTQELDDLYPRDFITALETPDGYFGTEKLFGRTPDDAGDERDNEEGIDVIRTVDTKEVTVLQPPNRAARETFQPEMTKSLETAVLYFLACCAARRARGDAEEHMTMLVHTSAYVAAHNKLASLIQGWVDVHRKGLVDSGSEIGQRLAEIWINEQQRIPTDITTARRIGLEEIFDHLPDVLDVIEFPVENGSSDDRIDYTDANQPRTYIVVGGSILSRGLTLEGLMVSFFLRSASQYDTLLQMGRWFGYRRGYEDLPRIWMPDDLRDSFRALAAIEDEIRAEIAQYRNGDRSPMEVAVRIRTIPGMAITSASKMHSAYRCDVSYWGMHKQTIKFARTSEDILDRNWAAGSELISRAEALKLRTPAGESRGARLWRGVPASSIIRFLETYQSFDEFGGRADGALLTFIRNKDARLANWSLGIVESRTAPESEKGLGTIGRVNTVIRARLKDDGADDDPFANVKALMSKVDILHDCPPGLAAEGSWDNVKLERQQVVGQTPMLLLYPIHARSRPKRDGGSRTNLDAALDVLGYGIIFPGLTEEGGDFVSVKLRELSADQVEEIDAEEQSQLEAAGVD